MGKALEASGGTRLPPGPLRAGAHTQGTARLLQLRESLPPPRAFQGGTLSGL